MQAKQVKHFSLCLLVFTWLAGCAISVNDSSRGVLDVNVKRGIVFLYNSTYPDDHKQFAAPGNVLSWYYNYGQQPSPQLANSGWEFTPMVWGRDNGPYIKDNIEKIKGAGGRINFVLGFNEPEMPRKWGGSDISPIMAANQWSEYIEPLTSHGIKLCTPGVSSSRNSFDWLAKFFLACSDCTFHALCLHHYGRPALNLKKHLERYHSLYPDLPIWLTEYADSNDAADATEAYMNESLVILESAPYVQRYSYFGASRELVSRVGPNAAFLDNSGNLKPMGEVYVF
ncbi:hypothetical protein ABW19_dt0203268 [Dactylella cylindrospora]|nr:hypothetical protein ABW19_dt0203268 [Dactylella cylindrospora]